LAVTLGAGLRVVTQLPVPEQAPLQPKKAEPDAGLAVSVTLVPLLKEALQLALQVNPPGELAMAPVTAATVNPPGELETVPVPVPEKLTLSEEV